jgi:hypothetical protein
MMLPAVNDNHLLHGLRIALHSFELIIERNYCSGIIRRDVLLIDFTSTPADDYTTSETPRGPRTALSSWRRLFSS